MNGAVARIRAGPRVETRRESLTYFLSLRVTSWMKRLAFANLLGHVQFVLLSRHDLVAHLVHQFFDQPNAEAAGFAVVDELLDRVLWRLIRIETESFVDHRDSQRFVVELRAHNHLFGDVMPICVLDDVGAGLVYGEFQVRNLGLFELRLASHRGDEVADHRQVFSRRRDLQGKFSFEGRHLDRPPDLKGAACPRARRLLHSALAETPKGGRLIVEHFKNVLKAQNFERVFDPGREAANLDVAAAVANLFYEAHEDAQAGG